MITEIVIDTNVLAHCYNANEQRSTDALALVNRLLGGCEVLCIDEGFDVDPARNRSIIGHEYLQHVRIGTPGFAMIVTLASAGRIRLLPLRPDKAAYRYIIRLVRDRGDRAFLGVAYQTATQLLVSHDFADFDQTKRNVIRREIGVDIIEAEECCARL